MFGFGSKTETAIKNAVEEVVRKALQKSESALALAGDLVTLRAEVEALKIEKARREEEIAKKEREIEHKVGLERKRQAFEVEQAKRETTVGVREENLKADQKRFADQLKFHEDRFTAEVGYLKEMLSDIVQRLPSAEIKIQRKVNR